MKFLVFTACLLSSVISFAGQRIFDCKPTAVYKIKELPAEYNLLLKPTVLFREAKTDWSLQVAQYIVNDNGGMGPAVKFIAEPSKDLSSVSYYFQIGGSLEFQLVVNTEKVSGSHEANLFWWRPGQATAMATLSCEVTEQ